MPTGYTAAIQEGATFHEFVMTCARAFGALVTMRDEPLDAEIPEFVPDKYYAENVASKKEAAKNAESMTLDEAASNLKIHNEKQAANREDCVGRAEKERRLYEAMLAKVKTWEPPTSEHHGLKEFMVKQITESIEFDCHDDGFAERCYPSFNGTPVAWRQKVRADAAQSLAYAEKSLADEIDRCDKRNAWVKALRDSLKKVTR